MEVIIVCIVVVAVFLLAIYGLFHFVRSELGLLSEKVSKMEKPVVQPPPPPQSQFDSRPLEKKLDLLPNKVLQSITSSANVHKGSLGELIGYIQLHASYDRLIPLGNIVDFVCIKFPTDNEEGHVDFIDIKTGKSARLNKDQKALQTLIKEKKINFIKLKVETTSDENKSK